MNPRKLLSDPDYKTKFYRLAGSIFTYKSSMDNPSIPIGVTRLFARRSFVKSATAMYTEGLVRKLRNDPTPQEYRIVDSIDTHAIRSGLAEYTPASPATITLLNNTLREPDRLVLHRWGLYECTTNDIRRDNRGPKYNQSTLALLVDVPAQDVVDRFGNFPIWVAPSGTQHVEFLQPGVAKPTKAQLQAMGWREVSIGTAPERVIVAQNRYYGRRKQYALKHTGASTVNKAQGDTLPLGAAVKVTSNNSCPWQKEQVVVAFSRTRRACDTIIVGRKG